ncbi:MAG TPA: hypothetical protein VFA33_11160 [Bryobacteraceae bacterium]|nr:hypothetical protein [Bryobacteraceae bacterium]
MPTHQYSRQGGSAVEFALLTVVWAPLLLGTLAIGTTMIRGLQTIQVVRDTGHMYARGVDFSLNGNQAMVAWLGQELGMAASGGQGVVILSTITYVGRYQCKAAGVADSADPPNPTAGCTNYGHFVFAHRLTIGNKPLRASSFGNPDAALVDATTGYITSDNYVKQAGARADSFTLLPKPKEDGTDGFQAGGFAYVVEAYFLAPEFPGFLNHPGTYSYALF